MVNKIKLFNKLNEKLDIWVEGKQDAEITVVFVHGFAVDKHETARYFDDLSSSLNNNYRTVRFDFSGCGNSQGKLEEKDCLQWSKDLSVVIDFVKNKYKGEIYIFAQSMGCFVTALLSPDNIKKTVFTGIPNSNIKYIIDRLFSRFIKRPGGKLDLNGISIFPRSSGEIQKIGPSFWKVLKDFQPKEKVETYSKKTSLMIVHPLQDEVVGNEFLEVYSKIPNVIIKHLNGNHAFTKKEDRDILIKEIENFLQ
ncbi:alpha/beta fold hydrolase [Patescibacteria group bacterium]|nr:alpha/beta fold hydrolase [Patescibacteria group bacterium]